MPIVQIMLITILIITKLTVFKSRFMVLCFALGVNLIRFFAPAAARSEADMEID